MPTQTLTANATASITASGSTRVNGTISWTRPTIPEEGTITAIRIVADSYTWGGRGNFTLTINGSTVSSGAAINVSIPVTSTSPYSFTGVGGNKNATGANCRFSNLHIEYDVNVPSHEQLYINMNGTAVPVKKVYKQIGSVCVLQEELSGLFDTNSLYVRVN